ncbi:hypothetical protein [Micromonospora sp. NPDC023633]
MRIPLKADDAHPPGKAVDHAVVVPRKSRAMLLFAHHNCMIDARGAG